MGGVEGVSVCVCGGGGVTQIFGVGALTMTLPRPRTRRRTHRLAARRRGEAAAHALDIAEELERGARLRRRERDVLEQVRRAELVREAGPRLHAQLDGRDGAVRV